MGEPLTTVEAITARIRSTPFNRWMGIEAVRVSETEVTLRMPWRDEMEGAPGWVHGGLYACMIDVGGFAILLRTQGGGGPTVDLRVDFHANTAREDIFITGRMIKGGSRISTVEVFVRDGQERLLASGRCVYIARRGRE